MRAGSTLVGGATMAAWTALATAGPLHLANVHLPLPVHALLLAVAAPVGLAAAVRSLSAIWRGPDIVEFSRDEALACLPADADAVRSAAQLRGTMGGAGYLHPARLLVPAAGWLAAVTSGVESASDAALALGPWPALAAVAAALSTVALPARPFFYREVTGGGVLASPPAVARAILKIAPAPAPVGHGPLAQPGGARRQG